MIRADVLYQQIQSGAFDAAFSALYPGRKASDCRRRYCEAVGTFSEKFGEKPVVLVSAPGRTEVCGNHTDHQRGRVLAAAVDLDIICVAARSDNNTIRIISQGYPPDEISLESLDVQEAEKGTAAALIRGTAAWFARNGHTIGGFDAYTTSEVLGGAGLSSSAAFEVAIGNILNTLFGNHVSPEEIAIAGQFAENHYFGKPSGLMDQMASSVGGFVQIDFKTPTKPEIVRLSADFAKSGLALCIVDTGGSHANLTGDYAQIAADMRAVAQVLGKEHLRDVDEQAFYRDLARIRAATSDRAVLRAMHFFADNALVLQQTNALERGDVSAFLDMVVRSGRSSFMYLQNIFSTSFPHEQGLSLALALSERVLSKKGAWRVHGGGFAGTIQAFVPTDMVQEYKQEINAVFGDNACHVLSVRPYGGLQVTERLEQ